VRLADNSVIYSAGLGSVEFQPRVDGVNLPPIVFHDVLHVPKLGSNLLSVFHLTCVKGYEIGIVGAVVQFKYQGRIVFTATVDNRNVGYLDGHAITPSQQANCVSTLPADLTLWHRHCSHLNHADISKMRSQKLVTGMVVERSTPPDPVCEFCILGKQRRHNIP
jgi:hypothetical protein